MSEQTDLAMWFSLRFTVERVKPRMDSAAGREYTRRDMALSGKAKVRIFLFFFAAIAVVALYQTGKYYYYRGWSRGTKTGIVRKIAYKGPPFCKYIMGEMVMQQGSNAVQESQVWEFSVDVSDEQAPIVVALREAEKTGKLATLRYRQDLHMWWRCAPTEYFVTSLEK
jgi:hypothetical protein